MHQNYEDGDYPSPPDPDPEERDEINQGFQATLSPRDTLAYQDHLQNQETGRYISKDDILNLRIDLETTVSVQEFLWATK